MKMKLIKRNAVILTVIAFLGAAVYLNWSYSKEEDAAAAGINNSLEGSATDKYSGADEAAGLFYEEENSALTAAAYSGEVSEYFATARLTKQQARDSAVGILQEAANLENATQEVIDGAVEEMEVLAGFSLNEVEMETLIKAKGFAECVVFLDEDSVTVAVSAPDDGLSSSAVSQITDIIISETGMSAEQIKIIQVK